MSTTAVSRRNALSGAATIGIGLPLLAACGDDGGVASEPSQSPSESPSSSTPQSQPPASAPSSAGSSAPAAEGIASTSDVPVGGGIIIADSEVVITQPSKGDFKAFTAVCTHQGCLVAKVTDTINCPCHGSMFSIEDGVNVGGPDGTAAGSVLPLSPIEILVQGDQISLA